MAHKKIVSALLATAVIVGCQQYRPKPLDLSAHRSSWQARHADGTAVVDYVRGLVEAGRATHEFDIADGISLDEAQAIAMVFNPSLRESRARAHVADAAKQFAGLWDDPTLNLDVLRMVESMPDPWMVGVSVGFTIPLSGRLPVEKDRANTEAFAALMEVAEQEWEVAHELRTMWLEWSSLQLRANVAKELIEQLASIVEIVDRLERAGEQPRVETRLFRIEAAMRQTSLHRLQAMALDRELAVRELMGMRPEAPLDCVPQMVVFELPAESEREAHLLEHHPALQRLRAEYQVAEHTLHREIRKQYPDLMIGPAYELEDGQSRVGFMGAIPLPVLNRNRKGIAEAQAEREARRVAAEAMYETLVHQLHRAGAAFAQARMIREHLELSLIPLVDEQVRDSNRMLELGELNTMIQLESVVRQTEAKLSFLEALLEEALAAERVRALLGPTS